MSSAVFLLARETQGLFTRAQANSRGVTNRMIRLAISRGELEEVFPAVFRLRVVPYLWHLQMRAVLLWAQPAVASHRAAAAIWGLDGCAEDAIEITTTRRLRAKKGITLHVVTTLPSHVRSRKGLLVTSVERTLLDLAAVCGPGKVENALDDALRQRLTTLGRVQEELEAVARKGRNGCGMLRGLVTERCELGRSESKFERALFRQLKKAGIPLPVKQHPVLLAGRNCRFDFAYPGHRLAIEALGYHQHSERSRWESDHERHNLITLDGWRVLYVTYRKLCSQPEFVTDVIRRALGLVQL